ncbi:putative protein FAR1-RELATED SEQUENCE 10 [Bienertia sinuspersici]
MRDRFDIITGLRECDRAKCRALNVVVSLMKKQYGILKPYLIELVKYKIIVSMLEEIRLALMERMKKKKDLLEEAYEEQRHCDRRWNGEDSWTGFEVIYHGVGHAVELQKRTCSCRSWELTGIPCAHTMSAILYMRHQPEGYLAYWYRSSTYEKTYDNPLQPVPRSTFWNHEGEGLVLPPDLVKRRPGKKARRKDSDEPSKGKVKYNRKRLSRKCGNCGEIGHSKNKCSLPLK